MITSILSLITAIISSFKSFGAWKRERETAEKRALVDSAIKTDQADIAKAKADIAAVGAKAESQKQEALTPQQIEDYWNNKK
jgi:hypothetical protein